MREFSLEIIPSAADIDELGHVNNAVWVRWMQDVATAHWNAVASSEHIAKWIWVVVRHEIDYAGNIGVGETVTARTWISDPPKGARFDRNMEFTNAAGMVVVRSRTTWAIVNRASGRIARVPREVAASFMEEEAE
ncbi:MAG: acyl-CoA thioesterase [Sphingomonadales bacterium]|nr:acyl-CoA thioesterase [Sphingomonadales bacterium]